MDYRQTSSSAVPVLQDQQYSWDAAGNLTSRQDIRRGYTENFYYDNLHRLDYSTLNGTANLDMAYDSLGNITSKSGVGTYTYHPTKIHAVSSINTGSGTWTYAYDANGNRLSGNGVTSTYYANDQARSITKDSANYSTFQYAPSGSRWHHSYRTGGNTYNHVYAGKLFERISGSPLIYKHYVYAGQQLVAVHVRNTYPENATFYALSDHLGSVDAFVTSEGVFRVGLAYDAYGKRRGSAGTGDPTANELLATRWTSRRGFTEHEHLDSTGLVHMGGRVYDPVVGRFLSADPFIDGAANTQGYNRYSYVHNRPLSAVDPSGFGSCHQVGFGLGTTCTADPYDEEYNPFEDLDEDYNDWLKDQLGPELEPIPGHADPGTSPAPGSTTSVDDLPDGTQEVSVQAKRQKDGLTQFGEFVGVGLAICVFDQCDRQEWISGGISYASSLAFPLKLESIAIRGGLKAVNLPAWRRVAIDMAHVLERHTVKGTSSAGRTTFPELMNEKGIERAIREAYRYGEKVASQGDRVLMRGTSGGLTIEMWVNRVTEVIETAYPVFP